MPHGHGRLSDLVYGPVELQHRTVSAGGRKRRFAAVRPPSRMGGPQRMGMLTQSEMMFSMFKRCDPRDLCSVFTCLATVWLDSHAQLVDFHYHDVLFFFCAID